MLFDNKQRTRMEPMKPGENEYAFYDSSARPEFQAYRDLVNGWTTEFPASERVEAIARLRKSDNLGYQAALAELTIHATLIRQGYIVEVHPTCKHPTCRPDFLAKDKNCDPVAFIEVTTFGPSLQHNALSNQESTIRNAIDKMKLPIGFRLSYEVVTYGQSSPNLGTLCKDIETWAAAASHQESSAVLPSKLFEADDWEIEIGLRASNKTIC